MNVTQPRIKPLQDWPEKVNAVLLWQHRVLGTNTMPSCYCSNGRIVIVSVDLKTGSWGIYTSPTESTKIDETLAAVEKSIGL